MQSLNRFGRALLVVSAMSMPALAFAETPPAAAPKAASAKKDSAAKKKDHPTHAAKQHKDAAAQKK